MNASRTALLPALLLASILVPAHRAAAQAAFAWPEGKRAALSLSFDDARASQVEAGLPLFARYGARVTFYVVPGSMEQNLEGWRRAVEDGHEIGNHSLTHPCSGTFPWAREKALENYTLARMRDELTETNRRVEALLGVTPETFAYPCGQTFVGRGRQTQSYVPLAAELFTAARGWLDEHPNDPAFTDLAQVMGMPSDGLDFAQIEPLVEQARQQGLWLVLAGHDIGESGRQTTRTAMLEELLRRVTAPDSDVWVAPVGEVARYILDTRATSGGQ